MKLKTWKDLLKEEEGMGTVEIILIIVVLVGLVIIFKEQITEVVESIFSIPGMGNYLINAINSRDYAVVQAGVFVTALWFGLCMLGMDLVYAWADPRILSQYKKGKVAKR